MGLLDDAIREHLELKRFRGADPGEVAREEDDALGPVGLEAKGGDGAIMADDSADAEGPRSDTAEGSAGAVSGQETLEINMDAELGREDDFEAEPREPQTSAGAAPVASPSRMPPDAQDSLEWERPSDHQKGDMDRGPADKHADDDEVPAEDVLEETPDFLRETPEHERLWFEQQPPRDFDFNE